MAPKPAAKGKGKEEEPPVRAPVLFGGAFEPSGAAKTNAVPLCLQPPPVTGTGKFHFKNGAIYEGEWMQAPPAPGEEPAPAAPPAKPDPKADPKAVAAAAEASAAAALESMQRVRHGRGQLSLEMPHRRNMVATHV